MWIGLARSGAVKDTVPDELDPNFWQRDCLIFIPELRAQLGSPRCLDASP